MNHFTHYVHKPTIRGLRKKYNQDNDWTTSTIQYKETLSFLLAKDLNLRTALETLHLSPRTMRLVQLLWHTLSQSFTTFIHHENVVTQFSPRASTCQKKYGIIKEYFDVSENLSAICENVQANLDIIRYIYSNIHAEVYYASDEGLAIERKIKQLLQNNGLQNNSQRRRPPIMNTQPQPVPMVQQQQQHNNMTVGDYLPYGVTKR